MIKAVIFDFNGVFLRSEYLTNRLERKYGVPSQKLFEVLKEIMAVVRRPGVDDSFVLWKPHLEKLGLKISKKEFFDFWFSGEKLVPELLNYVKQLKQKGFQVFIISNNFKERTEYYRQKFPEIFKLADKAYFSWETGFVKPDKQAYKNILEENNLKPEECAYFDDSKNNVAAAKQLGIKAQKYQGLEETKKWLKKAI